MSYKPYYEGGWQSGESGGTPITPEALTHMDDGIAAALMRPCNLLDNSDFRNPVNQRGQTTYESVDDYVMHTIDRWHISSAGASVTVEDGYVSKAATTMSQKIAGLDMSKTYTAVVCSKDGTVSALSGTIDNWIGGWSDNVFVYSGEGDLTIFALPARGPSEVIWAALYEGEYTAETLPEYKPKGYAAELAECQRYYVPGTGDGTWHVAHVTKSGYLTVVIPTLSEMRVKPTIVPSAAGFGIHIPGAWNKLDETLFNVFKYPGFVVLCVSASRFTDITLEAGLTYLVNNLPALSADL